MVKTVLYAEKLYDNDKVEREVFGPDVRVVWRNVTDLSQLEHLLQTAEQIRHDGHPRWFILTGLIHDLGKILCLFGEPQWAVVGDTFPVGCRYSEHIVFPEFFPGNPDWNVARYQTECGIYEPGCGLDRVHMSWGHDEYLYQVVKDFLPPEALYMIRYHSFYAAHRDGEYTHLMDARDRELLPHDPFKALVAPRPIGWISTLDDDGVPNLAPYSFFNAVCDRPPMLAFSSAGRKDSMTTSTWGRSCSSAAHKLRDSRCAAASSMT